MPWNSMRSLLNRPTFRTKPTRARPRASVQLKVENLERRITPSFSIGATVNATQSSVGDSETAIVVNPTNPQNLFVGPTEGGAFRYSLDGGATWADSDRSTIGDGSSGGDMQMAWDSFGNLFVVYFADANLTTMVGLSTDGGKTFTLSLDTQNFFDQPEIAAGAGTVWIDYPSGGNREARG